MKTSTKIFIVIFLITLVGSFLTSNYLLSSINIVNGKLSFNFTTFAYISLALTIVNFIVGNILYIKFLRSRKFNSMLFFSTAPLILVFGVIAYFLSNINNLSGQTTTFVRTALNISETNYNSNGVKERCLSYQYRSDFQDYDYSVLATNATYYSNSGVSATFTFKVGNVYHLLYPKFDIARKKDVTYIGNDSVVTCTDYHNIDYKIGSDSAIIRKCLSEIVHRKDQTLEKVYTYPINNTIFANSYFLPVVKCIGDKVFSISSFVMLILF